MKRSFTVTLAGMLMVALCIVGYSKSAAKEVGKVYIGYVGPLTGPAAYIGIDALHGCIIAAEEMNKEDPLVVNGKQYEVEIVSYDDEMKPAKSVAGLKKLKGKYDISILFCNLSGTVMAVVQENEALGVLVTGFFQTPDAYRKDKLVLGAVAIARPHVAAIVKGVVEVLGAKTYASYSDGGKYGKTNTGLFKEIAKEKGYDLTCVAEEWFDPTTTTDFRPILTKIRAANPDVIVTIGYDEAQAGVIIQAREFGINQPFINCGGLQTKAKEMIGPERLEGCGQPIDYFFRTPTPKSVARYWDLYKKKAIEHNWKESAAIYGLIDYQAMWTMKYLMEAAGSVDDAHKIRAQTSNIIPLPELRNVVMLTGWLENGEALSTVDFGIYHDGKLYTPEALEQKGIKVRLR